MEEASGKKSGPKRTVAARVQTYSPFQDGAFTTQKKKEKREQYLRQRYRGQNNNKRMIYDGWYQT